MTTVKIIFVFWSGQHSGYRINDCCLSWHRRQGELALRTRVDC
jgi:hypothetical protein